MKFVVLFAFLAFTACRPNADRVAAERSTSEQRADVTDLGGSGTPARRNGSPVAKGADKAIVPPGAVIATPTADDANISVDASAADRNAPAADPSDLPLNNLE